MKQGNNMINEGPGRVCVVEVSAACRKMAQGVKVVMNIWLWWLFLTGGIIWMLCVDMFLMSKLGRKPCEKRKFAVTGYFLYTDKHNMVWMYGGRGRSTGCGLVNLLSQEATSWLASLPGKPGRRGGGGEWTGRNHHGEKRLVCREWLGQTQKNEQGGWTFPTWETPCNAWHVSGLGRMGRENRKCNPQEINAYSFNHK